VVQKLGASQKEEKLLDERGLLDKIEWYDIDFKRLSRTLNNYADDFTCHVK
jgi:hypothetical protein